MGPDCSGWWPHRKSGGHRDTQGDSCEEEETLEGHGHAPRLPGDPGLERRGRKVVPLGSEGGSAAHITMYTRACGHEEGHSCSLKPAFLWTSVAAPVC